MNKDLNLCIRTLLANLLNLIQRQLPGQNNSFHPLSGPELHRGKVHRIGLYRQVDGHIRPGFAHHHDQTGVRHNQCIRSHGNDRLHVTQIGLYLAVVRGNIVGQVEFFAQRMSFIDAFLQIVQLKVVIADP